MNTSNLTTVTKQNQDPTPARRIEVNPAWIQYLRSCPFARTRVGTDGSTGQVKLFSVTCKRWGCSYCAAVKIRRLAWLTQGARPNRLLTLTVDPSLYLSPTDAWEQTRAMPAELFRSLRAKFGEVEYLKVTELHKSGFPHYHSLLRSSFLPHTVIKSRWQELTGARIVDVRKVTETFVAYSYLTKYLTKLRHVDWTERHVAYSRNFFNPADLEKWAFPELENVHDYEDHPLQVLSNFYEGEEVLTDSEGVFILPHEPSHQNSNYTRDQLGLPKIVKAPAKPQHQKEFLKTRDEKTPRQKEKEAKAKKIREKEKL